MRHVPEFPVHQSNFCVPECLCDADAPENENDRLNCCGFFMNISVSELNVTFMFLNVPGYQITSLFLNVPGYPEF